MTMVVLGFMAVKLEISITITAVGLGMATSLVFVRENVGVFVSAGGSEFVLVSVNLWTVETVESGFNGLVVVGFACVSLVGSTEFEVTED